MSTAGTILAALSRRAPITARVIVIAAHPDDETIGLGATVARFRDALLAHVTDGAPRDGRDMRAHGFSTLAAYAAARERELTAALAAGGAVRLRRARLGFPDGEAWRDLAGLARRVRDLIRAERPAALFVHPYEGGHPDHDAAAFAAHAACRMRGDRAPALIEMTSYYKEGAGRATGSFLPGGTAAVSLVLNRHERRRKRAMLDCFATQRAVLAGFATAVERYRAAPDYDFTRPPHPGRLYYEGEAWGIAGALWRERAAVALAELGLAAP
ncbi:MAG TPA: PIG-L family deacetylase [Stellaceae bacterium]|nr:PIG-L family deacetylase [Stellaceae bacterium]